MRGGRRALSELSGPSARCHAMDCKNGLSRHAPGARNSCSRRDDPRQREPNWSTWIFHYSLIYCLTNPAHYHGSGWQDPTVRRPFSGVENWPIWSWAVFSLSVYYYYRLFNIPKQLEIVMNNKQRASLSKPVERDTACGKNRGVFNIAPTSVTIWERQNNTLINKRKYAITTAMTRVHSGRGGHQKQSVSSGSLKVP